MKKCLFAMIVICGTVCAREGDAKANIGQMAQMDAVSFDGVRLFLGLLYAQDKFCASINEVNSYTDNKLNLIGGTVGVEYSKSFKKGFLLGVNIFVDFVKSKKIEDSWARLNKSYADASVAVGPKAILENNVMRPGVAFKGGFLLKKYKSTIYAKVGFTQINAKYKYQNLSLFEHNVHAKQYVPFIGLGLERKFNKKFGFAFEAWLSFNKTSKKYLYPANLQKTKMRTIEVRALGTYSIKK